MVKHFEFITYILCITMCSVASVKFTIPRYKLLSGYEMPTIGLSVGSLHKDEVDSTIAAALNLGHRFIDGAFEYENEKEIGQALKKWFQQGGKREELFITGKMPMQGNRPEDVSLYLNKTLSDLDLDYIDMYLFHFAAGTFKTKDLQVAYNDDGTVKVDLSTNIIAIWKEMENQVKAGKAKSIGLANFNESQLMRIWNIAEIKPSNLQMETNVYLQQTELVEKAQKLGIVVSGYRPTGPPGDFGSGINNQTVDVPEFVDNPVVKEIAEKYEKSALQIVLQFNRQRKIVVNTSSYDPKEMEKFLEILNFTLKEEDMEKLRALDLHGRYRKNSRLDMRGIEKHPEYPWPDFAKQEYAKCN